jgi:hypothetical protein
LREARSSKEAGVGKRGRKPYRLTPARVRRALNAARTGSTDPGIAGAMGCKKSKYYELRAENAELMEAIEAAKDVANMAVVESTFKRAVGYEADEVTKELVPVYKDGKIVKTVMAVSKIVRKQILPEYNYTRLWLLNRAPKDWRDKSEMGLGGDVILLNAPTMIKPEDAGK